MVEELKLEWKKLWRERVDDKVRAEGVANSDYSSLFVEKGTIIHATRDFKALAFREILDQHQIANGDRFTVPSPYIGGWTKFFKTQIKNQSPQRIRHAPYYEDRKERQHLKKRGRGWLHI
jgi:hypothetical protein